MDEQVVLVTDRGEKTLLSVPCEVGSVSDGYHTFDELYEHRYLLFINLVLAHKEIAFKTWRNLEGEKWDGWFILAMNTVIGQISYHLPDQYWGVADVREVARNSDYDGHTPDDVVIRLSMFAAQPKG